MVFDKVNHLSSSHLHILSFSRMFNQNCIILFSEGQLVYHWGTRIDLIEKNVLFYLRLEQVRWLRRHTHIIAFQFYTGRARSMWICFVGCEFLFDIWEYLHHITPQRIRIIYDSGAFFFFGSGTIVFAKTVRLLEPADGTCRRRAGLTLCVTHRFIRLRLA